MVNSNPAWWGWGEHALPPFALYTTTSKFVIRSSWEGRYTPPISPLPFSPLWLTLMDCTYRPALQSDRPLGYCQCQPRDFCPNLTEVPSGQKGTERLNSIQVRVFWRVEWNWSFPGTGIGKQSSCWGSAQHPATSASGVKLYTEKRGQVQRGVRINKRRMSQRRTSIQECTECPWHATSA